MKIMKSLIRRVFKAGGYNIVPLHEMDAGPEIHTAQGQIIKSPMDHNTREKMDEFFSNEERVKCYLEDSRLAFYESIIEISLANGIEFEGRSVVDVGCGTGHLLSAIGQRWPSAGNRSQVRNGFDEDPLAFHRKPCSYVGSTFKFID